MTDSEWMFTTDACACLTRSTNDTGAPATGTTGCPACAGTVGCDCCASARDGSLFEKTMSPMNEPKAAATTRLALFRIHIFHTQVVEEVVDELRLFLRQVSPRLFAQHAQDVDGLLGQRQVRLARARIGMLELAEVHQHRRRQRHDEHAEVDLRHLLRFGL